MLSPILSTVIFPDVPAVTSKAKPPSSVFRVMAPFPAEESRLTAAVMIMGVVKVMLADAGVALVVVIFPAKETVPAPFCKKAPFEEIVFPAVVVKRPLLVIVIGPLPVVVTLSWKVIVPAVRLMPEAPLVLSAPLKVALLALPSEQSKRH